MKVLVFGKTGQLARSLQAVADSHADIELICVDRAQANLETGDGIERVVAENSPDLVINAAAYTQVDQAESEPERAMLVNGKGAGLVAKAAGEHQCPIIHISTDYVFDGTQSEPYFEDHSVNPINVYGRSKYDGELQVAEYNRQHVIVRTSWVISPFGSNFVKTMMRLGGERDQLSVVNDQFGCPTHAMDLADALFEISRKIYAGPEDYLFGIFNFSNSGRATWMDVARQIFEKSRSLGGPVATVNPITTAEYPTPARRPQTSLLSLQKIVKVYGISPRDWHEGIDDCVEQLLQGK